MSIASLVVPWRGVAYRHIPDRSPNCVLDSRFAGLAQNNRWNRPGELTFYLASDHAVLVAEFARHLLDDAGLPELRTAQARRVYDLHLALDRTLDLRNQRARATLDLADAPTCFLDREITRTTAGFLRRVTGVHAILVPSVAFLDDPTRWVLVIFLENLAGGLASVVRSIARDGLLSFDP